MIFVAAIRNRGETCITYIDGKKLFPGIFPIVLSKETLVSVIVTKSSWHITRPPSEKKIKTNLSRLLSPVALGCFKAVSSIQVTDYKMVIKCCVYLCGSSYVKSVPQISFFKIPAVKKPQAGIDLTSVTAQRRKKWLQELNLDTSETKDINKLFVCSKHFLSGIFPYIIGVVLVV